LVEVCQFLPDDSAVQDDRKFLFSLVFFRRLLYTTHITIGEVMNEEIDRSSGLILVHVQNDFFEGGALPTEGNETILPILNQYLAFFHSLKAPIFIVREWHSSKHISFQDCGGHLPVHCVRGTHGADLHADLHIPYGTNVVSQGVLSEKVSTSCFDGTDLRNRLQEKSVKRIFIGGFATEHDLMPTVIDGRRLGYETYLLIDAVRGMAKFSDDAEQMIDEIFSAGANTMSLNDLTPAADIE